MQCFEVGQRGQLPELVLLQRVVVQHQRLEVGQPPGLRRQGFQVVVAKVQEQQVGEVDKERVRNCINTV